MSHLQNLQACQTRDDVATLLGFKASAVAYLLHRMPLANRYSSFTIKKKSGGDRQIDAPIPQLKKLQRHLANLLTDCQVIVDASYGRRRPLAHGFRRGRSIMTNARVHSGSRYVLNVDIQDFFPSINFGRVRGFFIKNNHFALQPAVATTIAQIACNNNLLPQGSPCSPVISNLVCQFLDIRLAQLAKKHGCTYTRYADDLTFSTNRKDFPPEIATCAEGESAWQAGTHLTGTIQRAGFAINEKKTRMHFRPSRQMVTGLIVNKKVNVRAEYWRAARAMSHSLFTNGSYYRPSIYADGPPTNGESPPAIKTFSQIEGILNHIHRVRDFADLRKPVEKKKEPTSAFCLYRDLLHYKHFAGLQRPLIICEGKTDSVYLRSALKSLAAEFPALVDTSGERPRYGLRFLRFSKTVHEVMQLGSGSGELMHLIRNYSKLMRPFKVQPRDPVILLIDNDDGAAQIFKAIKDVGGQPVSLTIKDDFYYLGRNLYVVKTPERGITGQSCIEDLFEPSLLQTELGGKKLNLKKEHESAGEYSKHAFAEKVVAPNFETIDFTGLFPS